jgi:hypothetical protein
VLLSAAPALVQPRLVCRVSEGSFDGYGKLVTEDAVAGIAPAQQEDIVDIVGKLFGCCVSRPEASQEGMRTVR